jgi:hypothetical protein
MADGPTLCMTCKLQVGTYRYDLWAEDRGDYPVYLCDDCQDEEDAAYEREQDLLYAVDDD